MNADENLDKSEVESNRLLDNKEVKGLTLFLMVDYRVCENHFICQFYEKIEFESWLEQMKSNSSILLDHFESKFRYTNRETYKNYLQETKKYFAKLSKQVPKEFIKMLSLSKYTK